MASHTVGQPLPRAAEAWVEDKKWHDYVLGEAGHGPQWQRVFRVEPSQSQQLWAALARLARDAPVSEVRSSRYGIGCGVRAHLTFNGRRAPVVLAFFYDRAEDRPGSSAPTQRRNISGHGRRSRDPPLRPR